MCGAPDSVASAPFATMLVPASCCSACMAPHQRAHQGLGSLPMWHSKALHFPIIMMHCAAALLAVDFFFRF